MASWATRCAECRKSDGDPMIEKACCFMCNEIFSKKGLCSESESEAG